MRVGMLGSISWRTPPRGYGPWELVTSLLTEALVARGLDVTLFATADSITSGKLQAVAPRGYSEEPGADAKVLEIQHIRSEEYTSELQSLMRISYAVFCLKKKKK